MDRWRRDGIEGAGIKIAVLDSGFRGYRECLGKSLPERVAEKSFRRDADLEARDSPHGVCCAEVIHALAPKSEIMLATWEPDDSGSFLEAVRWCRRQGAQIVSCSVLIPAFSDGEGKGQVHRELAQIFGDGEKAGGMLAFASAGNLATRHWGGRFHDNGRGWHSWHAETVDNRLAPWGNGRVFVEVVGGAHVRCHLEITDHTSGSSVGVKRTHPGDDRFSQAVAFLPQAGHAYSVRVGRAEKGLCDFHLIVLGAWLQYSTPAGSIMFPGDGAEWITVGAIDPGDRRSNYSSCGPNSTCPKPELVSQTPFPLAGRERPFSGTSASAPQAAGLAALIWSRHRNWSAHEVRDCLQRSAVDIGLPGHDFETGFGRLALPSLR